ncbi:MAG: cytochrome o ubiquinol oxidase subunit IV [Caulobacteraceae bacterium]|nr:cytochrome o ubiquinol oxidase subunit IV [Caulobacteraceae bacterium]
MSAVSQEHGHGGHGHDNGHGHGHGGHDHPSHGSLGGYLTGFALSVVLTAIPFFLVMHHVFADNRFTVVAIMGLGAIQIIVHMIYFLHMNTRSEGGWTVLALIFTGVLLIITLTGSLWVMYHLNVNMMPMSAQDMRNMP